MNKINQNGWALPEVMVALVIFAFVMLGTNSMIIASIAGNERARERTSAYYETQRWIETVNHDIQMTPAVATSILDVTITPDMPEGSIYTVTYLLTNLPNNQLQDRIKVLTVTITWLSRGIHEEIVTRAMILMP